jgi:hypothetical protein
MGLAGGLTGGSEMRSESSPHYLHLLETALITEDIDRKRFLPRQVRCAHKLRILDTVSSSENCDHDPFGARRAEDARMNIAVALPEFDRPLRRHCMISLSK